MKKILLLIVSGLLIAGLAGTAMADDIALLSNGGPADDDEGLVYSVGSVNYLSTEFSDYRAGTEFEYSAIAYITEPGEVQRVASPAEVTVSFSRDPSTKFTPTAADPVDDNVVVITLGSISEVPENSEIVVSVSANNIACPLVKITAVKNITAIPEFPTVALPVAAILGLVFIFGRKKDGL
jgi:hypothetical protein